LRQRRSRCSRHFEAGDPQVSQAAQRLFFALWPDSSLCKALHDLGQRMREEAGGRVVAANRIHLTLVFLGDVPVTSTDGLYAVGDALQTPQFELELTRTGVWKRSAVGWIAPGTLPDALEQLVGSLRRHLVDAGFAVEQRPFKPHVTLLRKVRRELKAEQVDLSYRWIVDSFSLVRSQTFQTGPAYTSLRTWRLNQTG